MKKINYLLGFIMIVILSCSQQDDNAISVSSKSFETSLNKNSIDVSKYQNPMSLEGNIKVWVNKNNELVAYTETETHIHLFILQYLQTKIDPQENFKSIAFLDHSFSLISDSGKNILCEVKGKKESVMAGDDLKLITGISNFEKVTGGGVAHMLIDKNEIKSLNIDIEYDQIKLKNSIYNIYDNGSDPLARGCHSGGVGSTSCSVPGCSVSCARGYYSCCIPSTPTPSCGCLPNVPVIE